MSEADKFKAEGNAAFAAKHFDAAIELFTKAIAASDSPNHVLYSNRSAAYASLRDFDKALKDANECVKINPAWGKGWNRKGAALFGQGDLVGAKDAYETAVEKDPSNTMAINGLKSVNEAIEREAASDGSSSDLGMGQMFSDPQVLARLASNPKTKDFVKDPEFMAQLQEVGKNPMAALQSASKDPRLMQAIAVALGIDTDLSGPGAPNSASSTYASSETAASGSTHANAPSSQRNADADTEMPDASSAVKPEPVGKEPVEEEDPEIAEKKAAKTKADAAKVKGNALYKQRKFDEAIACYDEAWNLNPDITYLNNRAAAEYEKGAYEAAIVTCQQAIEHGREVFADYKVLAKAFARAGNAAYKLEQLPTAIEFFNKALTEHRTPEVLSKLRAAEKELKIQEAAAYVDPQLADEAREQGNMYFKEANWPQAVKSYGEAIKRAPKDPRGYANRAAAYLKLMSFPEVVKDCDAAIAEDSTFFKAYSRKATAQLAMREYVKCINTLDEAREIDPEGRHAGEIDDIYSKALSGRFSRQENETEQETLDRASKDPEVLAILQDPIMNTILQQAQGNPAALRDHMKNPEVRKKINLLAAAGIIRTR